MTDFSTHPVALFLLIMLIMFVVLLICSLSLLVKKRRARQREELEQVNAGFIDAKIYSGILTPNEIREMNRRAS